MIKNIKISTFRKGFDYSAELHFSFRSFGAWSKYPQRRIRARAQIFDLHLTAVAQPGETRYTMFWLYTPWIWKVAILPFPFHLPKVELIGSGAMHMAHHQSLLNQTCRDAWCSWLKGRKELVSGQATAERNPIGVMNRNKSWLRIIRPLQWKPNTCFREFVSSVTIAPPYFFEPS